jgi:hypothetical protein
LGFAALRVLSRPTGYWLKPDLVPRLMAIIHTIAENPYFQFLVISRHDINLFRGYADRILSPGPDRPTRWRRPSGTGGGRVGRAWNEP